MAFEGVPWFVEGGAMHSAESARLIAYLATGGQEGVLTSTSLALAALPVPGGAINVMPGAGTIRNRALGGDFQSYVMRSSEQTQVPITPTGSSGPRTDLVIARVENPHISGEPWNTPADVTNGPYVFPRVVEGVDPAIRSIHELELGYSAITLGKLTIPANTGTVTASMITDLRSVCNPTTGTQPPPGSDDGDGECEEPDPVVVCPGTGDDGDNSDGEPCPPTQTDYFTWPSSAAWNIKVPAWANYADIEITVSNAQLRLGSLGGLLRLVIGGLQMWEHPWRCDWPNATVRNSITSVRKDVVIPANLRGKTLTWALQFKCLPGFVSGMLLATKSTQVKMQIKFKQKAG